MHWVSKLLGVYIIALFLVAAWWSMTRNGRTMKWFAKAEESMTEPNTDVPMYMRKRSSCYSCETQYGEGQEWRGQPSKCFSCEAQLESTDPFRASRTVH